MNLSMRCRSGTKAAFSLIEVMIVVVILGILITMAVPAFAQIVRTTRINTLAHDLRVHATAFDSYASDNGSQFPPSAAAGVVPDGMEGYISAAWQYPPPIGGQYEWRSSEDQAFIQIRPSGAGTGINVSLEDLQRMDERFDDGDTSTGILQIRGNRVRYYLFDRS